MVGEIHREVRNPMATVEANGVRTETKVPCDATLARVEEALVDSVHPYLERLTGSVDNGNAAAAGTTATITSLGFLRGPSSNDQSHND